MKYNTLLTKLQVTLNVTSNDSQIELDRQQVLKGIVESYGVQIPTKEGLRMFAAYYPQEIRHLDVIEKYTAGQDFITPSIVLEIYEIILAMDLAVILHLKEKTYITKLIGSEVEAYREHIADQEYITQHLKRLIDF
ncbi:MAG: hypothetical protein HY785_29375 [Oscillatoriophycideae cyanobacterium NC_groundwater_1537_Pr4_S-0.65um_50_18]|nr:hypothetical protein [Oscillatoriophycideae cyanobacterium NC_groundwater_1537_Pr4_S-0.65um_50_18]